MSAITREEIEGILDRIVETERPGAGAIYLACARVAALVEERMKERVCVKCGEPFDPHHRSRCAKKPPHGLSSVQFYTHPVTRAQFEADREG